MTTCGMVDRYRRWLEHEREAFGKAVASLETVPEARRGEPEYQKAVDILAHLPAARRFWLERFDGAAPGLDVLFPKGVDPLGLADDGEQAFRAWADRLASFDDDALAADLRYAATEGSECRTRVEDVLTQLFTHSFYHRGQVATLVARLGGTPAVTDFVFWAREQG